MRSKSHGEETMALIQVSPFLFESEVLGYDGGILIALLETLSKKAWSRGGGGQQEDFYSNRIEAK